MANVLNQSTVFSELRFSQVLAEEDEVEAKKHLPEYILSPLSVHYGPVKGFFLFVLRTFLSLLVVVFLRPRSRAGELDQKDVDKVYDKRAKHYDRDHHITTRGMDLSFRKMAAWLAAILARNRNGSVKILDLCTGTGEIPRHTKCISELLHVTVDVTGLDYNEHMLAIARRKRLNGFVRGDATELTTPKEGFVAFGENTFDGVTQVFGIGGISEPVKVFRGVLEVLKPRGTYLMIDMHRPIPELSGEMPFFGWWLKTPVLEAYIYEKTTLPLVLERLWGWRDTTMCFYLLPLVTYDDGLGQCWGFETQILEVESHRWWFGLPIMPVAKIVVKKVAISTEEAKARKKILQALCQQTCE